MEKFHMWSTVVDRYVSTIYRRSSVYASNASWYYETMIFEWDSSKKKLGNIVGVNQSYDICEARKKHWQITESLIKSKDCFVL